jgi:DNA-binding NarL/FixJ family response regulator
MMFELLLSQTQHARVPMSKTSQTEQAHAIEKAYTREQVEQRLTPRELAVVLLASQELTNKEIATRLNICVGTAKLHRHNAYKQLQIHGKQQIRQFLRWIHRTFPSSDSLR